MTDPADFRLSPTVSVKALTEAGSDTRFRQMISDLLSITVCMDKVRKVLAKSLNVTGPQYSILMAIASLQGDNGVSVSKVADHMHVTGPFITVEVGKLLPLGLVEKRRNPKDARSVLLSLSAEGGRQLTAIAPTVRGVNDQFFGGLSRTEFLSLARITASLVDDFNVALAVTQLTAAGDGPEADQATQPIDI